jgi:hypothetical protein
MSLLGRWGNASAVVIDMSQLPPSSFNAPPVGNTGALRVGRGANAIEWLTILGNPKSGAGVETDVVDAQPASVRVAHVVEHESVRGVDVRNVGAAMSGRRVAVRIEFSEFYHGVEAVRVANLNEALGGELEVTMAGNSFHDNAAGCLVVHNRASEGKIRVRSIGDRVEHNRLGCLVTGGLITGAGVANANTTEFEAFGSSFSNNTSTDWENTVIIDRGGLVVLAAETPGAANTASGNTVSVALWATTVRGNQNEDFQAFGARSTASPPGIAGTDNHATIALHGLSRWIDVVAVNSMPADPGGTNTVSIVR